MKAFNKTIFSLLLLITTIMNAQVGIGTAEPKAILHIKSSDSINPARTDGILLPRITKFPAINPNGSHHGLLVHLTETTTFKTETKVPGFYYWHNPSSKWINLHTAISNILGSYWSVTGNEGTDASTNFIGTTDDKSLNFKVNNVTAGVIQNNSPYTTAFGYNALASSPTGIHNSAFGHSALTSNTTGYENTAIGYSALTSSTTSSRNTAVGSEALKINTTGVQNVAIGSKTLMSLASGQNNTAVGDASLFSVTNASYNTAIGSGAMFASNGSGSASIENNVAVGRFALYQTKGSNNVGIGKTALGSILEGDNNVAIGSDALTTLRAGSNNVAVGYQAMNNSTVGNNIAIGYQSLYTNTNGIYNTAVGYRSLYSNTETSGNSAMGYYSLYNNLGASNTAHGLSALFTNTTGNNNTASGAFALHLNTTAPNNTAYGAYALYENATGSENTAVGYRALFYNKTGRYNIAIGDHAGSADTYTNLENTVAIGHRATVTASNTVRIGNDQISSIGGQVVWTAVSDGRIKDDVTEDVPGIDFIKTLRPVTYNLNTNKQNAILNPSYVAKSEKSEIEKIRQTGFIAQEVEASAKKLGYNFSGVTAAKNENDLYSLSYATFVVPLVKAVQEQQEVIERLLKQNLELEKRLLKLEKASK